jgi:glycosyltransferase involved in cell wall biosynthesis
VKRFLLICMRYPIARGDSYLTTELAEALIAAGHEVEVLHLDWDASGSGPAHAVIDGVRVVRCPAPSITGLGSLVAHASKFALSGRAAARAARWSFDLTRFDVAIAWMPATAIAPLVPMLKQAGIAQRLLFVWDFFPDHHREIGRIPGGLAYRIARRWEQRLLEHFTAIVCTLPRNAAYLRRHFRLRDGQRVLVTPIWSVTAPLPRVDRDAVRRRYGLPLDWPIAVFGGQLAEGRGIEQMLDAAEGSAALFLFVGDGRRAGMVRARAAASSTIAHLPPLGREAYLELLGACDVGMVATVAGVTSYSIPSKTTDYLRAGLPVVAALEPGNELAELLERFGVGSAVALGDASAFRREVERWAAHGTVRAAATRLLGEVFDVRHAVATVLAAAGEAPVREAAAA